MSEELSQELKAHLREIWKGTKIPSMHIAEAPTAEDAEWLKVKASKLDRETLEELWIGAEILLQAARHDRDVARAQMRSWRARGA